MDGKPIKAVIKFEDGSEEEFATGSFILLAQNSQPPMYAVKIRSSISFNSEKEMLAFSQEAVGALNNMIRFFLGKKGGGNEGFSFSSN